MNKEDQLALKQFELARDGAYTFLLTPMQAARQLGVSKQRIYQLIESGALNSGFAYDRVMVTAASVHSRFNSRDSHVAKQ